MKLADLLESARYTIPYVEFMRNLVPSVRRYPVLKARLLGRVIRWTFYSSPDDYLRAFPEPRSCEFHVVCTCTPEALAARQAQHEQMQNEAIRAIACPRIFPRPVFTRAAL